jgi:hypothetical protein
MPENLDPAIYQLKVVLFDASPMTWSRSLESTAQSPKNLPWFFPLSL